MKKTLICASGAFAIAALPAAAQAQDMLGKLFKSLTKTTASAQTVPLLKQRPVSTVEPSAEQAKTMHALVGAKQSVPQVDADLQTAAPLMEKLVKTTACGVSNKAYNDLNREAIAPKAWNDFTTHVARQFDEYHDGRFCYDVVRVTNFTKPAANALEFTAFYVSPTSQRGTSFRYTIQRTPEGQWLFKNVRTA